MPNRMFAYNDLDAGIVYVTEKEIIDKYYPFWKNQMIKAGKSSMINEENCIEDFIVVNWAWEIKQDA